MNLPFEATCEGYRFALVGLEPGNSAAHPVAQSAYRATAAISPRQPEAGRSSRHA